LNTDAVPGSHFGHSQRPPIVIRLSRGANRAGGTRLFETRLIAVRRKLLKDGPLNSKFNLGPNMESK